MKGILAGAAVLVIGLIITLIVYLGGFKSVTIEQSQMGPYKLVYKRHLGAYYKIVPVIEEVEKWAKENGEACSLSFGEYLDDPSQVDEDRQRSNGGCIVARDWSQGGMPEGFEYREIPERRYVAAEFNGAPSISPFKVYPKVGDYIKENNLTMDGPVIEIYQVLDPKNVKTQYLFPVK